MTALAYLILCLVGSNNQKRMQRIGVILARCLRLNSKAFYALVAVQLVAAIGMGYGDSSTGSISEQLDWVFLFFAFLPYAYYLLVNSSRDKERRFDAMVFNFLLCFINVGLGYFLGLTYGGA